MSSFYRYLFKMYVLSICLHKISKNDFEIDFVKYWIYLCKNSQFTLAFVCLLFLIILKNTALK